MLLVLSLVLVLTGCSKAVDNSISPAQASAPTPTAQQEKVAEISRNELQKMGAVTKKETKPSVSATEKAKDCNWGVASEIACPVHPEKQNSSK